MSTDHYQPRESRAATTDDYATSATGQRNAWEHICYEQPAWFVAHLLTITPERSNVATWELWDWAIDAQPTALDEMVWDWYRQTDQHDTDRDVWANNESEPA